MAVSQPFARNGGVGGHYALNFCLLHNAYHIVNLFVGQIGGYLKQNRFLFFLWCLSLVACGAPSERPAEGLYDRYPVRDVVAADAGLRPVGGAQMRIAAGCRARGQFAAVVNRQELWQLLATITIRKVIDQQRLLKKRKRGGGRVRGGPVEVGEPRVVALDAPLDRACRIALPTTPPNRAGQSLPTARAVST